MAISFHRKGSFQNEIWYIVFGHPFVKRIEAYSVCDPLLLEYQRRSYNGDADAFVGSMIARQGGVKVDLVDKPYVNAATHFAAYRFPKSLYLDFVKWLKDAHAEHLASYKKRKALRGYTEEEFPAQPMRPIPRPIFFNPETNRFETEPWFHPDMALVEPVSSLRAA